MATTHLHYTPKLKAFILSEANSFRSRENIVVTQSGAAVPSGTVLTKVDTATTGTFAMDAGMTGNPTSSAIAVGGAGLPGAYRLEFTSATKFSVEDPNGKSLGTGTLGTAFNKGGLTFTLTAGGTAAVVGDTAAITVAEGSGKYVPYVAGAAADAILYNHLPAKTGDSKAVGITNDAEVKRSELTGLDANAEKLLRQRGIKVRGTAGLPSISTPAL